MSVHSWDLFDTLIGRKCGPPARLWDALARQAGDDRIPWRRVQAEAVLQKQRIEYSLDDIYRVYGEIFEEPRAMEFRALEWQLELENTFPIRRYAQQLGPRDIIVSDMYLSEGELRALLERAGIRFSGRIFVSCYGKHTGRVWDQVKGLRVLSHCGDHQANDVEKPKKHGIRTVAADTKLSEIEQTYPPDVAWWARHHRLAEIADEQRQKLELLEIECNVPFLRACCELLADYARREKIERLLFMSRDGQMFERLWRRVHPEIKSKYLYISRECLRAGTENYFTYLNHSLTDDAALVDLAASCGSLKVALPRLSVASPRLWCAVFLESFGVDLGPIRCEHATTNRATTINNTALEMLNYADHWHVADYVEGSGPVYDQANEYDMHLVQGYHQVVERMIEDAPAGPIADPQTIVEHALARIHAQAGYLRKVFPEHLLLEKKRKRQFEELLPCRP